MKKEDKIVSIIHFALLLNNFLIESCIIISFPLNYYLITMKLIQCGLFINYYYSYNQLITSFFPFVFFPYPREVHIFVMP